MLFEVLGSLMHTIFVEIVPAVRNSKLSVYERPCNFSYRLYLSIHYHQKYEEANFVCMVCSVGSIINYLLNFIKRVETFVVLTVNS